MPLPAITEADRLRQAAAEALERWAPAIAEEEETEKEIIQANSECMKSNPCGRLMALSKVLEARTCLKKVLNVASMGIPEDEPIPLATIHNLLENESNQTLSIIAGYLAAHDEKYAAMNITEVVVARLKDALPLGARTVQSLLAQGLALTVHDFSILFAESRLQRLKAASGLRNSIQEAIEEGVDLFPLNSLGKWTGVSGNIPTTNQRFSGKQSANFEFFDSLVVHHGDLFELVIELKDMNSRPLVLHRSDVAVLAYSDVTHRQGELTEIWTKSRPVEIRCPHPNCPFKADLRITEPGARVLSQAKLLQHLALDTHPAYLRWNRHKKTLGESSGSEDSESPVEIVQLPRSSAPPRKKKWQVICYECKPGYTELAPSAKQAEKVAVRHVQRHFIHRSSPFFANYTSSLLRKWTHWFPNECLATLHVGGSQQPQLQSAGFNKLFPEVVAHRPSKFTINDLKLAPETMKIWFDDDLTLTENIRVDFVVRLGDTVHVIEDDPHQHRQGLMRTTSRTDQHSDDKDNKDSSDRHQWHWLQDAIRFLLFDRYYLEQGRSKEKFASAASRVGVTRHKPKTYHRVAAVGNATITVTSIFGDSHSLILPPSIQGTSEDCIRNTWSVINKLGNAPPQVPSVFFHGYSVVTSLLSGQIGALRPAVTDLTGFPECIKESIGGCFLGCRDLSAYMDADGEMPGINEILPLILSDGKEENYLKVLKSDERWLKLFAPSSSTPAAEPKTKTQVSCV